MLTLDELLIEIKNTGIILISADEAWSSPSIMPGIDQAMKEHRDALAALIAVSDTRVCPAPGIHRKSWRYGYYGRFVCDDCQRLSCSIGDAIYSRR